MVISICTRIVSGDEAASALLIHRIQHIASQNKTHLFYFITNKALPASQLNNVKSIVIKQESANPLLWKLWYNYKLPAVLKKIKADWLVCADGVCSMRTKISQCIIVNELEFLDNPQWYRKRYVNFIKNNLPLFLNKASGIVTYSECVKNELMQRFSIAESKIAVAASFTSGIYQPIASVAKEKTKAQYTGGNEYFLFKGTIDEKSNLTQLLKAFSLFKKRLKSAMQLLLLVNTIPDNNEFVQSIRLYKYRAEVKILEGISETESAMITASAWCAINLSPMYSDINFLQNALHCEVPAIAPNCTQAKEWLGDAALYANPQSIDSIAEQLMLIYKDENKYGNMQDCGKQNPALRQTDNLLQQIEAMLTEK